MLCLTLRDTKWCLHAALHHVIAWQRTDAVCAADDVESNAALRAFTVNAKSLQSLEKELSKSTCKLYVWEIFYHGPCKKKKGGKKWKKMGESGKRQYFMVVRAGKDGKAEQMNGRCWEGLNCLRMASFAPYLLWRVPAMHVEMLCMPRSSWLWPAFAWTRANMTDMIACSVFGILAVLLPIFF